MISRSSLYYLSRKIRTVLEDFECKHDVNLGFYEAIGILDSENNRILLNLENHTNEQDVCATIIHEILHYLKPDWSEALVEDVSVELSKIKPLCRKIKEAFPNIFAKFEKVKGGIYG